MKRRIATLAGLMSFALIGLTQAQDNWKWPSDQAMESRAREYNAAYNDLRKSEQYIAALKPLHWLLVNAPDLNEAIYINGVDIYAEAAELTTDEAQKRIYQDSVITLYEKRQEIYGTESKWIENKAFYAYKFYRTDPEKVADAVAIFDRILEVNDTISPHMIGYYFDLIYRNYAHNNAYTPEEILSKYEYLTDVLNEAEEKGTDVSASRGILDQLLVAMEIIDCDFIEKNMGPKLEADPSDIALAQQIFQYSIQYKCTTSPSFMTALEIIDENDPTFSTSQVIAKRYMQTGDFTRAEEMFQKALPLASTDEERGEVHMDLARLHSGQGRKSQARASATRAAELNKSLAEDSWTLIGNLYMSSSQECRGGQSRVRDYSIFIAAYDAYSRAGNRQGMNEARARFPSKEELFTEGYQAGDKLETGCWIGQTVTLNTRD